MKEFTKQVILPILWISGSFVIIVLSIIFLLSSINKRDVSYTLKVNSAIVDCVNRENLLNWCLENFNK